MPTLRETSPGQNFVAVTPHDSTNFTAGPCRSLYVGGAGNVVIVGLDNAAVTFTGVTAGTILPLCARRVNSTSTTATSIVAIY